VLATTTAATTELAGDHVDGIFTEPTHGKKRRESHTTLRPLQTTPTATDVTDTITKTNRQTSPTTPTDHREPRSWFHYNMQPPRTEPNMAMTASTPLMTVMSSPSLAGHGHEAQYLNSPRCSKIRSSTGVVLS
jgi:hypothetical protein